MIDRITASRDSLFLIHLSFSNRSGSYLTEIIVSGRDSTFYASYLSAVYHTLRYQCNMLNPCLGPDASYCRSLTTQVTRKHRASSSYFVHDPRLLVTLLRLSRVSLGR